MKATGKLLLAAAVASAGTLVATDAYAGRGHGAHGFRNGGHIGHHHWGGHRHWRGGWGLHFGAPLALGVAAWGWPYWYDIEPGRTIIYREREVERIPESYPEGRIESAPSTTIPRGEGTPRQGPLYMNYCASAQAYFPKVTTCPEGWRFETPTQ